MPSGMLSFKFGWWDRGTVGLWLMMESGQLEYEEEEEGERPGVAIGTVRSCQDFCICRYLRFRS